MSKLLTADALTEILKEKLTIDEFISLSDYPNQKVMGKALLFTVVAHLDKVREKIKGIENPYHKTTNFGNGKVSWNGNPQFEVFEQARQTILKALGGEK